MDKIAFTGGSGIGGVNATWPLAKLRISAQTVSLSSLGKYEFSQEQVIAFQPHGAIPFLASGIRIIHNRLDYPENIIFWCGGQREKVYASLAKCGFVPTGHPVQRPSGIVFRWSAILGFLAFWNVMFLLGRSSHDTAPSDPGPFELGALASVFVLVTAVQHSTKLQNLVLKKGRHVGEIKQFLKLIQLVTGLILVVSGIMVCTGQQQAKRDVPLRSTVANAKLNFKKHLVHISTEGGAMSLDASGFTISQNFQLTVGDPAVFEFSSPTNSLEVVFEDDGTTGYFYALDRSDEKQAIQEAMHIYNVANVTDRLRPSLVRMMWSRDGLKALLLINNYPHAIFDFLEKRGYCRTNYPQPGKWKSHDFSWNDEALGAFQ